MGVAASADIIQEIVASCERHYADDTSDPIFSAERRFDSTKQLVKYILEKEGDIQVLLGFLVGIEDEEEIATLATELSSSLDALKFGVAKKRLNSVGAGI